jgi:surface antigen
VSACWIAFRQDRAKHNIGKHNIDARLAAIVLFAANAAACSITLPMVGWSSLEDEPPAARTTGSLRPLALHGPNQARPVANTVRPGVSAPANGPVGFSRDLGPEDLRRAYGALGLALDPQGNGANVAWDNPQSGMKGVIMPVDSPFLKSDEICRHFTVSTALQSGPLRQKGMACRPSGGEWVIKDMQTLASG